MIRLARVALAALLLIAASAHAADPPTAAENLPDAEEQGQKAVARLVDVQQSLSTKQLRIEELRQQLKSAEQASDREELETTLAKAKKEAAELQAAFEHIIIGGVDLSVFSEQAEEAIDWRHELEQISMPILAGLKELTDKPRRVGELQTEIDRLESQAKVIKRALAAIESLEEQELPPEVSDAYNEIALAWVQRFDENRRALQIAEYQLEGLLGQNVAWTDTVRETLADFAHGRGLTLALALGAGAAIWLIMKGLLEAYRRWPLAGRGSGRTTRVRLALYSYRLVTTIIIVLVTLGVFYVRGDLLLLAIALIGLAAIVLSLRQTLPRYLAEMRLLLGLGPIRESERVVVDGIPYKVASINVYTVLSNPELEGVLRLPLGVINELASRPAGDEPWFPARPGEYVLLGDGSFAQVMRQTIERVELQVRNSMVLVATSEFLNQSVVNLSREMFGVAATFGIDYRHQAICLDKVPGCLRAEVVSALSAAGFEDHLVDVLVDFKEAAASSLDYLIFTTLQGTAAGSYHKIGRLIQRACVTVCNREGWGIPFSQFTVHQGDGFDALRAPPVPVGPVAPLQAPDAAI